MKLDNHEGDQVLWCLKNYATFKLYYKLVHYRFHENQLKSSKIRVSMFPNSFESRRAIESIPKWSYYPTKHQPADSRKSNLNKAPNYGLLLMSIYSKPNYHNSFWQSTIIGSKAPCLFLSQTFSSPIESALGTRNENCFCEQKEEKILCKIQNHGKLLSAYRGSVLYGGLESCGLMGCDIVIEIISHGLKVVLEFFFQNFTWI